MNGPYVILVLFIVRLVIPFVILMTLGMLIDNRNRQFNS
jgi:hypothetical protein